MLESVRQWPGRPGFNPRSSHTKDSKMVLDASLLNAQHYKVRIKGKVEQSREGVAPSPTHLCSSYRKGSLRVTLDYGRQQLIIVYTAISSAFNWMTDIWSIYSRALFVSASHQTGLDTRSMTQNSIIVRIYGREK